MGSTASSGTITSVGTNNLLNDQINKVNSVVSDLQKEIKNIYDQQNKFIQSIDVVNSKISEIQTVTDALSNLNIRVKALEDNNIILQSAVKDFENRLDSFEQSKLMNSVEITGVPVLDDENTEFGFEFVIISISIYLETIS